MAELFLTENCNLRWISCACWQSNTPDELSRDEWFNVIDQLAEHGFVKLNFTGGEALLRPDLLDILSYASTHTDAELHLNTNAILLSSSLARQIVAPAYEASTSRWTVQRLKCTTLSGGEKARLTLRSSTSLH